MPSLVLHGASGRMGRQVLRLLGGATDWTLLGALVSPDSPWLGRDVGELLGEGPRGVLCTTDVDEVLGRGVVDVVVDFSTPGALGGLAARCAEHGAGLVSGTTGLGSAEQAALHAAAERVAVLHAANFSLGVAALAALVRRAAAWLPDFDAEILELHHRGKADAPSGTALRLADAVQAARAPASLRRVSGREGRPGARAADELGVMALRGGDVAGEHTVLLLGTGERLELTHRATDRAIFARGALRAAAWLVGRAPGRYGIEDVLGIA